MSKFLLRVTVATSTGALMALFGACTHFDAQPDATSPDGGPETPVPVTTPSAPVTGVPAPDLPPDAGHKSEAGTLDSGVDSGPLEVHESCVAEINKHRAAAGVAPVARWTVNEACADGQAMADFAAGKSYSSFNSCAETGQNACSEWPAADSQGSLRDCVQQMWEVGPGDFSTHGLYVNLTKPTFTKAACGVFVTPAGKLWAVLDFQ